MQCILHNAIDIYPGTSLDGMTKTMYPKEYAEYMRGKQQREAIKAWEQITIFELGGVENDGTTTGKENIPEEKADKYTG